jgi:hypothetical protein
LAISRYFRLSPPFSGDSKFLFYFKKIENGNKNTKSDWMLIEKWKLFSNLNFKSTNREKPSSYRRKKLFPENVQLEIM